MYGWFDMRFKTLETIDLTSRHQDRALQDYWEQLSQFERVRIIGMMEAGWSARRVDHQIDRSDCVVRRRWDQWIQEMSFTRKPGSGCL
ncbi:transposable element Tcb2 transposase [Trichonephila clavipes]|nr:transposable element Tcb2 transposase [Trichonephila clavipes]